MSEDTPGVGISPAETGAAAGKGIAVPDEGAIVRLSARIGVWGTLAGTAAYVATIAGVTLPTGVLPATIAAGFAAGGIGIAATGLMIVRAAGRVSRRVLMGGMTAVPLGVAVTAIGPRIMTDSDLLQATTQIGTYTIVLCVCVLGVLFGSAVWEMMSEEEEAEEE